MTSPKLVFGSIIAGILLALYVYLVSSAFAVIGCLSRDSLLGLQPSALSAPLLPTPRSDDDLCRGDFTPDMASAMSLISGLLAALVVAELAITEPGKAPAARVLQANSSHESTAVRVLTAVYLGLWVLCGISALIVGWRYPLAIPALTDLGKTWFGLAIAAAYSYFRITPKQ